MNGNKPSRARNDVRPIDTGRRDITDISCPRHNARQFTYTISFRSGAEAG